MSDYPPEVQKESTEYPDEVQELIDAAIDYMDTGASWPNYQQKHVALREAVDRVRKKKPKRVGCLKCNSPDKSEWCTGVELDDEVRAALEAAGIEIEETS